MITEDQLEQLCLDWFREGGYDVANDYNIAHDGEAPEREDYKQPVVHLGNDPFQVVNISPFLFIEPLYKG